MHVGAQRSTDLVDRAAAAAAVSLLRSTDPVDRAAAADVAESRRLPLLFLHYL